MKDWTCSPDRFASSLADILGEVGNEVNDELPAAVARVARRGAKRLRSDAGARWGGKTGSRYSSGFASHVDRRSPDGVSAEIGNENMPGLVHLLEKGHATLTGRRTQAYPHMAPAFEGIADDLEREVTGAVERGLRG